MKQPEVFASQAMQPEQEQQDETKLDFSDHEAPTESVLLDDYGVEEAMVKQVEEPAFVVDLIDDKRSVQFSDVAGIDNFEDDMPKMQAPSEQVTSLA